jgi:hypothetical protein
MDNALIQRMIGAAKLDVHTYEEVERDTSATQQALIVVILAAVAAGIGALGSDDVGQGIIGGVISSVVGWAVFAAAVYFVGTRFTAGTQTQADWGQVARTMGFAYTPQLLSIFGFIPVLGWILGIVGVVWGMVASIVAIRQSLDFSTGRAVLTAIVAMIALLIVVVVVGLILGGTAAGLSTLF